MSTPDPATVLDWAKTYVARENAEKERRPARSKDEADAYRRKMGVPDDEWSAAIEKARALRAS